MTLGVVTAGGLKRRDVAVRLFRKALQIQPEIKLSPELATPEVQAAFDEAVRGLGNEPKVERLPSELLVHEPVTAGTRGEPITIAVTPDDGLHAERVMLAYRAAGASAFSKIKMQQQSDGVFEAIIPAPATAGSEVAYYIEARDLDDKLVAARGSPIAPMVIALAPRPAGAPPALVDSAPEPRRRRRRPRALRAARTGRRRVARSGVAGARRAALPGRAARRLGRRLVERHRRGDRLSARRHQARLVDAGTPRARRSATWCRRASWSRPGGGFSWCAAPATTTRRPDRRSVAATASAPPRAARSPAS